MQKLLGFEQMKELYSLDRDFGEDYRMCEKMLLENFLDMQSFFSGKISCVCLIVY